MWYLIVPPIIVVASLAFVLWYLSRKGADPLVAEEVSRLQEKTASPVSFPRIKTFFLRLLEKMAYRFKVMLLRMHNTLHNVTHSLKESQRRFQVKLPMSAPLKRSLKQSVISETEQDVKRVGGVRGFWKKRQENPGKVGEETVIFSQTQNESAIDELPHQGSAAIVQTNASLESPPVSRPMVSAAATHPDDERARARESNPRETELIARISANPKDFEAYEALGDYYLEIGNLQDAKQCYRQVLKLSPAQRVAKIKIRRLEKALSQRME